MSDNRTDRKIDSEDEVDAVDTLIGEKSNTVWQFGSFEFTSDALRFILIYIALMMVLAVGLYNLTVQTDMSIKGMWASIVSGSFFCMVPAPGIPRSSQSMFTPPTVVAAAKKS